MAVYNVGGGGGLLGALGKGLSLGASFVPGLQPFAPYIAGAGALAQGNIPGAVGSMAAPAIGNAVSGAVSKAGQAALPNESLMSSLWDKHKEQSQGWGWQ